MRFYSGLFAILIVLLIPVQGFAASFMSGSKQVALVELYTSEGCSSCPPADQWLSDLKNTGDLWGRFVALGFHVSYWDYLGWKDRFADPFYAQRQQQYSQVWNTGSVYTPAVVVNGMPWKGWRSEKKVPNIARPEVGELRIQSSDERVFRFEFKPAAGIESAGFDAYLAVVGFGLESDVKRGENSGRQLAHDFVVLRLERRAMNAAGSSASVTFEIELQKEVPAETGIVGWITYPNNPAPLQATGGMLTR